LLNIYVKHKKQTLTYRTDCIANTGSKENEQVQMKLECGPMPNVMAALPNTGGALCSTPQLG